MFSGCTSSTKNDTDPTTEFLQYVNINIKDFQNTENQIIKKYNKMEYANEDEIIILMKDEILEDYKDYFNDLSKITFKSSEITDIHKIYLLSSSYQLEAFEFYLSYLENQDYNDLKSVNNKIDLSIEYFNTFKTELMNFANKYNIPYN